MNRDEFLVICAEGTGEQVAKAIKSGADPNEIFYPEPGIFKNTVHVTVTMNNTEAAKVLIENEAYIDFKDAKDRTPLMYAVLVSSEMVKILLEGGADPNAQDINGKTALSISVAGGRELGVEKFMYFMIKISGFKIQNWEYWFYAAFLCSVWSRQEQLEIVRALLDNGADITICDNEGIDPVMYAIMSGDDEIFTMLTGIN